MDTKCETISGVPIAGYCRVKDTDIQWVEGCIKSREEHPEYYPDEDVPAVIAQQKVLLARLRAKEPRHPKPTSGRRVLIDLENNDAVDNERDIKMVFQFVQALTGKNAGKKVSEST